VRLDYLFLDGSHFKMHPGAPAEPVLAAWGIDTCGKPVFVGLAPASSESTDAWDDFLADLVGRGLGPPLLGISDGAAGLIGGHCCIEPSADLMPSTWDSYGHDRVHVVSFKPFSASRYREGPPLR
jgi:transposase-like protein